jgi:SAM-dependent methyltransferase
MPFPWHDRSWREVGEFVADAVQPGNCVLAPDAFWWVLGRVERYVPQNLTDDARYDWVVLDTEDMPQLPRPFLERVAARMTPALANDSFVVWSRGRRCAHNGGPDGARADRLAAFWARLARLGDEPTEPNRYAADAALADAPRIANHAGLTDAELREAMNDLYRRTGYLYPTLRDQAYSADIRSHVARFVDRFGGGRLLDVCSGARPFVDLPAGTCVIRSDLSDVGIELGRAADEGRSGTTYAVMDAHGVAICDRSVDAVLFVDSIEHVRDAARVFGEAARVLVPGGELLVTFANTGSVNQVIAEKLGHPRFVTNNQHIREYSLAEVAQLLDDAGFEIGETAGVSLYPYWGVPRLDAIVREITDNDPEVVEMMRELGRRVGAEYAYTGVIVAQLHAPT